MSYLTDGPDKRIQAAVETGVVPRLVELLSESFASNITQVLTPVLRTIGNIVTGNDFQTDCVINAGGLPNLRNLLSADKDNIVKEAAWSISNITAGNKEQIQAVIDAEILPPLINVLQNVNFLFSLSLILFWLEKSVICFVFRQGDSKSQKEAAWAVTNFTSGATVTQLFFLLRAGVIPPLCNLLDAKDWSTVLVVMDALTNILKNAKKIGELDSIALMIEECGGVDKLEELQNHENQQIYEKALDIIQHYFSKAASFHLIIIMMIIFNLLNVELLPQTLD